MVKLPENLLNIARNHYTMVREIGNALRYYQLGIQNNSPSGMEERINHILIFEIVSVLICL